MFRTPWRGNSNNYLQHKSLKLPRREDSNDKPQHNSLEWSVRRFWWIQHMLLRRTEENHRSGKSNLSRLMTKPTKWHVRPAKTPISLGICPVWSVFAVRMKKDRVLSYPLSAQRRLWSDQSDLCLRWTHSHLYRTCFSMGDLSAQVRPSVHHTSVRQHLPWVSCECNSSYSFVPIILKRVFFMVWGCAYGLDITVRLFFVTFATSWT